MGTIMHRKAQDRRIIALLSAAVLLPLAACSAPGPHTPMVMFAGYEAAALNWTGKTVSDHVVSAASGKNCSITRAKEYGVYCEEDMPVPKDQVYCYRSLAAVTCYSQPNPYGVAQQAVGTPVNPTQVR